jgi:hypothetical protein
MMQQSRSDGAAAPREEPSYQRTGFPRAADPQVIPLRKYGSAETRAVL